ncbi:immunoglobulin-like domain-containing protein [Bacillus sp. FJAT-45066]|uniref:immunoglobulin-like domain-containing protein n=1 Tax=Bacillus sp. FJAT-45066 TaxID=2011010 RepID=UPI000BB86E01|nr:immunoglobulin-like domain-containing protein [Bacillus sp. FJAT-45066]
MKRYLCLLFCIAISLTLLPGCGSSSNGQSTEGTDWEPTIYETVNNIEGVSMIAKEGTVSSTGLTVIFENNSDKDCMYGEYFLLEKKIEGKWYQVPVALDGEYGFNSIGYDLPSSDVKEMPIDWEWLYGSLDTGEYRIVKDIIDFRKSGDYDKYLLIAEFKVK